MKNLPDRHYAALTGRERTVAAFAAMARDDKAELLRLKDTCPRKAYRMTDPDYSERMAALLDIALATEADLRGWAATATFFVWQGHDAAPAVACLRAIDAALDRFAAEQGIEPAHLRAASPPRHTLVTYWLREPVVAFWVGEPVPEPDEARIERELQMLREVWRMRVGDA